MWPLIPRRSRGGRHEGLSPRGFLSLATVTTDRWPVGWPRSAERTIEPGGGRFNDWVVSCAQREHRPVPSRIPRARALGQPKHVPPLMPQECPNHVRRHASLCDSLGQPLPNLSVCPPRSLTWSCRCPKPVRHNGAVNVATQTGRLAPVSIGCPRPNSPFVARPGTDGGIACVPRLRRRSGHAHRPAEDRSARPSLPSPLSITARPPRGLPARSNP